MSTFWEDVLALNPAVALKLDEPLGTESLLADDSTVNGRDGTIVGFPKRGQAPVLPGMLADSSFKFDGLDDAIEWVDAAWMDVGVTHFIAMIAITVDDFAVNREIMGKQDMWQLWLDTAGRLSFYCTPPWTLHQSPAGTVTAGSTHFIILRKTTTAAGNLSMFVNGVKMPAPVAHTSNPSNSAGKLVVGYATAGAGGNKHKGLVQAFAYFPNLTLTDAELITLSNKALTAATIAATPGAFDPVQPEAVKTFSWGAAADPFAITYELQRWGGDNYYALASGLALPEYTVDTSGWGTGAARLRVRAVRTATGAYSPWVYSNRFFVGGVTDFANLVETLGAVAHYPLNDPYVGPPDGLGYSGPAVDVIGGQDGGYYGGDPGREVPGVMGDPAAPDKAVDLSPSTGAFIEFPPAAADVSNKSFALGVMINMPDVNTANYIFNLWQSIAAQRNIHIYPQSTRLHFNYWSNDTNSGTNVVAANTWHYLLFKYDAGLDESSIWVDGVKRHSSNVGPMTAAPLVVRFAANNTGTQKLKPKAQHLTFWVGTVPADNIIRTLYEAAFAVPIPPEPPGPAGPFTSPLDGDAYLGSDEIPIAFGVADLAESYTLEYRFNGGAWWPLTSGLLTPEFAWTPVGLPEGLYQLRGRGVSGAGVGDWVESGEFTITPPFEYVGALLDLFVGSVGADLLLFDSGVTDSGELYVGRAETVEVAPMGTDGECLFENLYIVIRNFASATVRVRPYVNGLPLAEAVIECPERTSPESSVYVVKLRELGMLADMENLQGVRGTWINVKTEITQFIDEFVGVEHVGVGWDAVLESHPFATFGVERLAPVDLLQIVGLYLGAIGDDLLRFDRGTDDGGAPAVVTAESADMAPSGVAEESIFHMVYLRIERNNPFGFTLRIRPVLDNVLQAPIELVLPAVSEPTVEVHELGLYVQDTEFVYAMRGVWMRLRYEADDLPSGDIILHGAAIEHEGTGMPPATSVAVEITEE